MARRISFAMVGIVLLLLAACGGGGGGGPQNPCPGTANLLWILVEPPAGADIGVGATATFTATGYYSGSTTYATKDLTRCATWTSSNESVATVSRGVVTGVALGYSVQITASYGTESDHVWVDVVPSLEAITIEPETAKKMVGETQSFTAMGHYDDGSSSSITYSVTWSSSNTSVATMSGRTATGQANGIATISASLSGITNTATFEVVSLSSIDVDPISTEVQETATRQFTATANYSDGSNGDITKSVLWDTSNPAITFISNSAGSEGLATGVAIGGPVGITASMDGITSAPASLWVTEKRPDLSVRVTGAISNGTELYVTYAVKNNGLANSTGFTVDVWDDLASPPAVGASGDEFNSHGPLAIGASISDSVIIPSALASGTAYAVAKDNVIDADEADNVSTGFPWPYSHTCADVVNRLGVSTLCQDITNGFTLTAPTGGYLSYGGYTFYPYASSGIGPKNVCSLALYGDGGVVREHPQSASTTSDSTLPYQQYWHESSPCGYAAALIDVGTTIDWTSYPAGEYCDGGANTWTVRPTDSVTCTYQPPPLIWPIAVYNFDDGLVPAEFTMSGNAAWYNEGTSLRSGAIGNNQTSCFEVTVDGASAVSFDRSVSSESCCDHLHFYVDGSQIDYWSGAVSWANEYFSQTLGTHTYKWCYDKDSSLISGSDAAWVDKINVY